MNLPQKRNRLAPGKVPSNMVLTSELEFDENGMTVLRHRWVLNKNALPDIRLNALSQPYDGHELPNGERVYDPRYEGMTKAEVMEHRLADAAASGDITAIKEVHDRLNGKPKQQVETKSLNLTYEDWLEELARQENMRQEPVRDISPPSNDIILDL